LLRSTQPHGQLPVAQSRTPVSAGDRPPNVSASSGTPRPPPACGVVCVEHLEFCKSAGVPPAANSARPAAGATVRAVAVAAALSLHRGMGKSNVPKAVGHAHDDKKSRQERAIAEHKAAKKLAAVHHNLRLREDSGGLSDKEQALFDLETKRADKALRAKTFLERTVGSVDPDSRVEAEVGKCIFYDKAGGCKHGNRCRFVHDGPSGAGSSGGAISRPANEALALCIEKLAARVAKVGLQFETVVLEKQGDNPAFAFLKGGEGADYYTAQKESAMSAPPP
jgi:hypothetical protein